MVLIHDEDSEMLTVAAVEGEADVEGLSGAVLPVIGTVFERALDTQQRIALEDVGKAASWPVALPPLRGAVVPFGGARGVLLVAYTGEARDEGELPLLGLFAGQAAVAIDREAARVDREALLVLSDRERIARDLHDVVIQRLIATGLQLQTAAKLATRREVADRVREAISALDATIRDIRGAIFELQAPEAESLRVEIRGVVDRAAASLGFRPGLAVNGPIDSAVPSDFAGDVLAMVGGSVQCRMPCAGVSRRRDDCGDQNRAGYRGRRRRPWRCTGEQRPDQPPAAGRTARRIVRDRLRARRRNSADMAHTAAVTRVRSFESDC